MSDDTFVSFSGDSESYVEEHAVEAGEYEVRITRATVNLEKGFILVGMEIIGDPYAKEVSTFINLPGSGRDERQENNGRRRRIAFMGCFGLSEQERYKPAKMEPEGYVGREGYVMLSEPMDRDDDYGPQNQVKKFLPRR